MTRADLQKLTRIRLTEARILLRSGCHEGAYYLAGYAVECAIKACIAKKVRRFEFPDRKTVLESYTHDLEKLLRVAGLEEYYEPAAMQNPFLAEHWKIVADWTEQARYAVPVTWTEADRLYTAIVSRKHGVLAWLRQYW